MIACVIQGWCPWCGQHMGWGGGIMMVAGWLIAIIAVLAILLAVARGRSSRGDAATPRDPAEDALREQYARGVIDEETFRRRLENLRSR